MITEEAEDFQTKLSQKVIKENMFSVPINIIAGCDVQYNNSTDIITGAIVLIDYKTKEVIEKVSHSMKATFPYIPGLFSFREVPPLIEGFKKLINKPCILICDAQGIAHPRGFGLASHIGVLLDLPTIGCAKKRLFGNFEMPNLEKGSMSDLLHEETNEIIGKVLRTQTNIKPLFVSIGHKIELETACKIVLDFCTNYRLPETTRLADAYALEAFKEYINNID